MNRQLALCMAFTALFFAGSCLAGSLVSPLSISYQSPSSGGGGGGGVSGVNVVGISYFSGASHTEDLEILADAGTLVTITIDAGVNYLDPDRNLHNTVNGHSIPYKIIHPLSGLDWGDDGVTHPGESYTYTTLTANDTVPILLECDTLVAGTVPIDYYEDSLTISVNW